MHMYCHTYAGFTQMKETEELRLKRRLSNAFFLSFSHLLLYINIIIYIILLCYSFILSIFVDHFLPSNDLHPLPLSPSLSLFISVSLSLSLFLSNSKSFIGMTIGGKQSVAKALRCNITLLQILRIITTENVRTICTYRTTT